MIQAQSLRQIKLRLKSIANTRKITRAMEMVSASKLSRVKMPFFAMKPYTTALRTLLNNVISDRPELRNPMIEKSEKVVSVALCIITSDTGLCGAYNANIVSAAEHFLRGLNCPKINIIAVGKEGFNHFRKLGFNVSGSYLGLYGRFSKKIADDIAGSLVSSFLNQEADEVYVAYSVFKASLRHKPVVEKILNIEPIGSFERRYIYEPDPQAVLDNLISEYVRCKFREILMESFTCEHSARMLAMKTATDNADDLTEQLTLARNKARQFAITKEVLEIAASAEALKG